MALSLRYLFFGRKHEPQLLILLDNEIQKQPYNKLPSRYDDGNWCLCEVSTRILMQFFMESSKNTPRERFCFSRWVSTRMRLILIYPVTIRWHTGHRTTKMARATVGIFSEWCMPSVCATFFPMVFFRMMPSMCAINRGTGYRFTLDLVDWCRNTKYKYVCSF